jgi:penicillin-binding protein 1A
MSQRPRRTHRGRRFLRGVLFGILLLMVATFSLIAGFYVAMARSLPTLELTQDVSAAQTTKIFDNSETPVLLAELHGLENREALSTDEIPQVLRDAVVAIEDERFYEHSGVDFLAILRAVWANITHGDIVQGASTITQQLIKNAFLTDEETVDRKLREAALAYQLEKQWSKNKILTEYLNIIYFGEGAYGIESAALTYFGVHAIDLTLDQAALLAGLPQAPSAHSPRRDPEAALARRDVVLNKMYQQGYITSPELQEALSAPLELAEAQDDEEITLPYWVEMVREQLVARYGSSRVLTGGLRVYISVDLDLQKAAEESIAEILDQPGDPSAALVTIDVKTGRMVAMVGGSDFSELQFNLATQGRRQPGSAFKPFVLVAALQQGVSPDTTYESSSITLELPTGPWEVSSADHGPLTLAQATAESSNGVYARLVMDLGADKVAQTAYDMGVVTSLGAEPNPAIALGGLTTGVSPLEMAMAYATLATGGERLSSGVASDPSQVGYPVTIVRVTDSESNLLDTDSGLRTRVLDEGLATIVTDCLQLVVTSGTGTAAQIGRPAAGKTGTTQNYADAWFVGYTPELVTAVWVGYPSGQKPMTDVHGTSVTGGSLPAQIWALFMKRALAGKPVSQFPSISDSGWTSVEVCSESHLLPAEYCTELVTMLFRADLQPKDLCTVHAPKDTPVPDVVGLSLNKALAVLEEAHFLVTSVDAPSSLEPAGIVDAQDPEAGSALLQGNTVTLFVSTGEAISTVPVVVGLDVAAARAKLAAAGLLVSEFPVDDDTPAGTVLSQDPTGGATAPVGWKVMLYVSRGPGESSSP